VIEMMNILSEIFAHKRLEVEASKQTLPLAELRRRAEQAPPAADFIQSLRQAPIVPALIAEVKFHSPSKGMLVMQLDPLSLAAIYAQHGAAAISVLTDEKFFHGRLEYLSAIHSALPSVPLLRKDFIFDPFQVYESRAAGASAILLIAASLDHNLLKDLHDLAVSLGMAALVEVHDEEDLKAALRLPGLELIGVNNRDLHTFTVRLETCLQLRQLVPKEILFVAESGIHNRADIELLAKNEVNAVLIGEALVTASDPGEKMDELISRTSIRGAQ
jgi:indole-3-glycerol phosphate synthase